MKTVTSLLTSSFETENILSDLRLQVFQNFVSFLLSRCRELSNLKTPEEIELLWRQLLSHLTEDRHHHAGLFGDEFFLVECGLADELLQKIDWPGRDWWKANLLELKLFQTRTVGDQFYRMIDKLLAGRKLYDLPFAIILLETLALGFHGRLTPEVTEDENSWNRYRHELGRWIQVMLHDYNKNSRRDTEPLPAVLHEESLPVIPSLRRWYIATIILIIGMLLISHYLWRSNVKPLYEMINRTSLESVQAAEPTSPPLGLTVSNGYLTQQQ
ncbi:MAG: DotU family type IV/VI secretion system protein [Planctomycetaceae bacterium]|jgi:type VI protein secretion system component VasF|nr:DotU family type IV/VI secretion system protein [Planctomycetaceae bacterium]